MFREKACLRNAVVNFSRITGTLFLISMGTIVNVSGNDAPPSTTYVTPIEDTLILTPSPKESSWVQPMMSYPCIGKANTGYLIVYSDSQGIKRAGLVPWRERMKNITADDLGDEIRIRPGTVARIDQGGVILKKDAPYRLLEETSDKQKVLYFKGSFTQEVTLAKSQMRPIQTPTDAPKSSGGELTESKQSNIQSKPLSPKQIRDKTLWGISKSNVKTLEANERALLVTETPSIVSFKTTVFDKTCIAAYSFTNGLLAGKDVALALPARKDLTYFPDVNSYVQEYKRLRDILKIEYGDYIEQQQDSDIATATRNKDEKIKDQQKQVDLCKQQIAMLQRMQKREMDNLLTSETQKVANSDDVFGTPASSVRNNRVSELKAIQLQKMALQTKCLEDAQAQLNRLMGQEPLIGWASLTSKYTANECKISLECYRELDGIRLFIKYRPLTEAQIQPITYNPPPVGLTSSNGINSSTITTIKGIKYLNCIIKRVEPDGLIVSSSKGISKLLFADLPDSYREKYGYDANKAATYAAEKREKQVAFKYAQEDKTDGKISDNANNNSQGRTTAIADLKNIIARNDRFPNNMRWSRYSVDLPEFCKLNPQYAYLSYDIYSALLDELMASGERAKYNLQYVNLVNAMIDYSFQESQVTSFITYIIRQYLKGGTYGPFGNYWTLLKKYRSTSLAILKEETDDLDAGHSTFKASDISSATHARAAELRDGLK